MPPTALETTALDRLLQTARVARASDLLLSAGAPPAVRIAGAIRLLDEPRLDAATAETFVRALITGPQAERLERERELDFALTRGGQRFRCNAYWKTGTLAAALRLIPDEVPRPDTLGLPRLLLELAQRPQGLLLLTGASDQGKTTTQASLVDHLNRSVARHIVTIEDPIEFQHASQRSIVDQREVGSDTLSFAEGLKHALRQSPDVLLLGEMRDAETIQTALHAAETGHLVLSTLHTNDACQAIERILDVFSDRQLRQVRSQLSLALLGVVAQRLVPRRGGGLALAVELLVNNHAVSHLVREGKTQLLYSAMETGQADGMRTMNQALEDLVRHGVVETPAAARFLSTHESRSERMEAAS